MDHAPISASDPRKAYLRLNLRSAHGLQRAYDNACYGLSNRVGWSRREYLFICHLYSSLILFGYPAIAQPLDPLSGDQRPAQFTE